MSQVVKSYAFSEPLRPQKRKYNNNNNNISSASGDDREGAFLFQSFSAAWCKVITLSC